MKSGTRVEAEGKMHQFKDKVKEIAGMVIMTAHMEAEGTNETPIGKAQERNG